MRYLKIYEDFNNIENICKEYGIENYTIVDGKVNVDGDVDFSDRGLTKLPLSFGVTGNFYCGENQLTTLEGSPSNVGGNFYCDYNQLTSLEGCPSSVGGDFYCNNNQLTSLEGCSISVGGDFYCYTNKLTSLEGGPISVGGDFYCRDNQLITLEGCPDSIGGDFYCDDNPIYEIYKLFNDYSKVELFNYMDIIYDPEEGDDRPVIYLEKLNSFLEEIGKPPVTSLKNYNCL
jgi:hypothetical protein